ncbi:unnamed protein product [Periconia digitata]|uniref:Uncharacterized protein n=1 Tax=Periconia digitata TaxID=1303443 RepID=A0A9W4U9P8_9PLEO|nr:unnamed protein product [Periconia digitata]
MIMPGLTTRFADAENKRACYRMVATNLTGTVDGQQKGQFTQSHCKACISCTIKYFSLLRRKRRFCVGVVLNRGSRTNIILHESEQFFG